MPMFDPTVLVITPIALICLFLFTLNISKKVKRTEKMLEKMQEYVYVSVQYKKDLVKINIEYLDYAIITEKELFDLSIDMDNIIHRQSYLATTMNDVEDQVYKMIEDNKDKKYLFKIPKIRIPEFHKLSFKNLNIPNFKEENKNG